MNIKTHPRFLFLVNIGLVSILLAGCASPLMVPVKAVETSEVWDRFEAKMEYLRQQRRIPGLTVYQILRSYGQHWLWGYSP
jgi:outer membrane biogenesis lipoprotein LolB